MTVLIAKVISRIAAPPAFYGAVPMNVRCIRYIPAALPVRKEYLTLAFLMLAVFAALVYVVEMNVIIFEGKKVPALEAALKELEHEQKLKYATLTSIRSPLAIKKEALGEIKMVEVKSVQYLEDSESVAANIPGMP